MIGHTMKKLSCTKISSYAQEMLQLQTKPWHPGEEILQNKLTTHKNAIMRLKEINRLSIPQGDK